MTGSGPGKSYQRIIREREAVVEPRNEARLANASVEPISPDAAASVILRYEWLGSMPRVILSCWGLFFDKELGGALVFAEKPGANLATSAGGLVPSDAVYLARGACAHWTPKNSASWFISRVGRMLGDVSILAYADPAAGEVGQIYRALNWYYLGPSAGGPAAWLVDGKLWGTRSIQRRFATRSVDALREAFPDAVVEPVPRKHRFLGVYGSRGYRRRIAATLAGKLPAYTLRRDATLEVVDGATTHRDSTTQLVMPWNLILDEEAAR